MGWHTGCHGVLSDGGGTQHERGGTVEVGGVGGVGGGAFLRNNACLNSRLASPSAGCRHGSGAICGRGKWLRDAFRELVSLPAAGSGPMPLIRARDVEPWSYWPDLCGDAAHDTHSRGAPGDGAYAIVVCRGRLELVAVARRRVGTQAECRYRYPVEIAHSAQTCRRDAGG